MNIKNKEDLMVKKFFKKHQKLLLVLRGIVLPLLLSSFFWSLFHYYIPQPLADAFSIPVIAISFFWLTIHVVILVE